MDPNILSKHLLKTIGIAIAFFGFMSFPVTGLELEWMAVTGLLLFVFGILVDPMIRK